MSKKGVRIAKLEGLLSSRIKGIYKKYLGQNIDSICLQEFDSTLVIILEGTVTSLEKLLCSNNCQSLAEKLRLTLDAILLPQVQKAVEQTTKLKVIDFLSDTKIDSNVTGMIIIFESDDRSSPNK